MKIESVDLFYFSMPEVLDVGDGSQDMLLVRVITSTGEVGWGECEAAPLVSITPLQGAATSIFLATAGDGRRITGRYRSGSKPRRTAPWAHHPESDRRLWQVSEELIAAGHP